MRRLVAAMLLLAVFLAFPQSVGRATGLSYLNVYPHDVHPGDFVYVSGANLLPNMTPPKGITIFWGCPTLLHPRYGVGFGGPFTTDSQGDFVGAPVQVTLTGIRASACEFVARYIGIPDSEQPDCKPMCPDIHGTVTIKHGTLAPCDLHICAKIIPHPLQTHAGITERIAIKGGWGGAVAKVSLVFEKPPPGLPATKAVKMPRLDWNGQATGRVYLPSGYARAGKVEVKAHFSLGSASGNSKATFTVVK